MQAIEGQAVVTRLPRPTRPENGAAGPDLRPACMALPDRKDREQAMLRRDVARAEMEDAEGSGRRMAGDPWDRLGLIGIQRAAI